MEYHQEVKTAGGEGKQDKGESSHYPSFRRKAEPDRAHTNSFRLTRSRLNQLSSSFTPCRNQQISGQASPFFTVPGSFQEKTRIQGQKQYLFQPKAERVRPNYPEAVGFGERSTQEPEIAVHTSVISSPISGNINPTQIEHDVFAREINFNRDALWLKMFQFAKQTHKKFEELQASHEMIQTLTASMDKIDKPLQEAHAHLRKAPEETKKTKSSL
ncbi:hypothetical protein O181_011424 [Austropuccinia psidii MF-1]|uniref:Uncharacterized protein n=1 Tax=Austropuccinia psidii MF-1 TaxID=1389203 RepID=A0A9Q3BUF1_9BASI|nr:hypothetical protein [Austropuccinia psidii MF-1]